MVDLFVGRAAPLGRLLGELDAATGGRAGCPGSARAALVAGQGGIGKTTLLAKLADLAAERSVTVTWGSGWAGAGVPAFWTWTQVLRGLLGTTAEMRAEDRAELGRLLPELIVEGRDPGEAVQSEHARFRLFDAVTRVIEQVAARGPLLVLLDDLQWADPSSLHLLEFLVRPHRPVPLLVVGAFRPDELEGDARARLRALVDRAAPLQLDNLTRDEVHDLLRRSAGEQIAAEHAEVLYQRTGGHPFFVRELGHLMAAGVMPTAVPEVLREAIRARLDRVPAGIRDLLDVVAVVGAAEPEVCAAVTGTAHAVVEMQIAAGVAAGVLARGDGISFGFAHDLLRETVYNDLTASGRIDLHRRVGTALETRPGIDPSVVAQHLTAAIDVDGIARAVDWARAAADADRRRLAFTEAAGHLRRLRQALRQLSAQADITGTVIDLLVAEADLIARDGRQRDARALLEEAHMSARRTADGRRLATVALGVQRLGARFAMPRDESVALLEEARAAVGPADPQMQAQLTAMLARELHHSIPVQRQRAGPLSEEALRSARDSDDPATLAECLLARHDILWTVGRGAERIEVARELFLLADGVGDRDRRGEALLLLANALLETGSPAFLPVLNDFLAVAESSGQPRDAYLALSRRAALALLDGDTARGEDLTERAAALGDRIGEPDTGNVRMSQLLEIVRAEGTPERLHATADEAIRWWVGVPSHAHAVAAGFYARAGDLEAARRALDLVVELDQWRDDRSYLWSVFMGQLATAAVLLGDRPLAAQLLGELTARQEILDACAVNGAAVCFMGANAHWAGLLCGLLGRTDDAADHLSRALATHERLGARAWVAESSAELASVLGTAGRSHAERAHALAVELGLTGLKERVTLPGQLDADAVLERHIGTWQLTYGGTVVHLRDVKGLHDLAALVARPGINVHVLDLAGAGAITAHGGDPVLDAAARQQYRQRLADLDRDIADADADNDWGRRDVGVAEREALLSELRLATGLGGRDRGLGARPSERARKAVAARLRDAIARIGEALPELGAHLDRSVITGTHCRYEPAEPMHWVVRG